MTKETIEKLIPNLSDEERQDIIAYYSGYVKYEEELAERGTKDLQDHPIFGRFIRDIPAEVAAARRKISKELQEDAIYKDNWQPYIEYQIQQGIVYAKMGLDFRSWYEVISLARKYIVPCLQKEYGNDARFLSALNGLNLFMDIGMGIIGEAYMQEKREIIEQDQEEIRRLNHELEQKVLERTAELEAINKELEAFSYSVSHDLRAPLRAINGFAKILNEDYSAKLDEEGISSLQSILNNSKKMGTLIDDLLEFSRLGRLKVATSEINMANLVASVKEEETAETSDNIEFVIHDLLPAKGGQVLIKQVWTNLISNAIKYSQNKPKIRIEIGSYPKDGHVVYYVKDNGAGFDMRYYDKLFGVFQRLHSNEEFEGTGIGLAIVKRIIHHHNGDVWAESKVNEGTCFNFSLPSVTA